MKHIFSFKKVPLLLLGMSLFLQLQAQNVDNLPVQAIKEFKNLIIREYNSDVKGGKVWLDHETVYNEKGLKILEVEYTTFGLKYMVKYKYDAQDRCTQDVTYDSEERPTRIRRYEYNKNGTIKKQYNYLPNGRLQSTKSFEYSY